MLALLLRNLHFSARRLLIGESAAAGLSRADVEAWTAELPEDDPQRACRMLDEQITRLQTASLPANRMVELVSVLHDAALPALALIDASISRGDMQLSERQSQAVRSALALLKRLSIIYHQLARYLSARWFAGPLRASLTLALNQGATAAVQRIELAQRIYARTSPRSWALLRDYSVIAMTRARTADREQRQAAHGAHARALLLALADPNQLGPAALAHLRHYLSRHAGLARITTIRDIAPTERDEGGLLALGVGERMATPLALTDPVLPLETLVLDARPLISRVARQLTGLAANVDTARLGLPREALKPDYQELLQHLLDHWRERRGRRHARARFLPRARLSSGFDAALAYLEWHGSSKYVVNGRSGPPGANTSAWAVTNESAAGLGLAQRSENPSGLRIGEFCCVHVAGSPHIQPAVIRRAETRGPRDYQLGVELLGGQARAVTVFDPNRASSASDGNFHAIHLPRTPALHGQEGLVCATGLLDRDALIAVDDGRNIRLLLTVTAKPLGESLELLGLSVPV